MWTDDTFTVETMAAIQKWGRSLAIRIPADLARRLKITAGAVVDIRIEGDSIVITPRHPPKYSLREMLRGITPDKVHPEIDWGPDVGREIID